MRIGIDARLWSQTGVGRYIRNLIDHLLDIDHINQYSIFITSQDSSKIKNQISKKNGKNWKIIETTIHWHSISEQIYFPRILNTENLDLMHFTYFSIPVAYKKPYVITIHDLIIDHFPTGRASTLPYPLYRIKQAGYRYVMSRAVVNAKKIIVPLDTIKQDLEKLYKVSDEKITVTYEGADEFLNNSLKHGNTRHERNFFLYAGNAYPHKNLENLIRAFRIFRSRHQDVDLVLAGRRDFFYERIVDFIAKEKFEGVRMVFDASDKDLADLYKGAIAYCSASKMEGFGLTPVEAASCGNILVLSDIPSFREIWADSAIYFDSSDISNIAEKLETASSLQKNQRDFLIKQYGDKLKKFGWKKMAERTLEVYENSTGL